MSQPQPRCSEFLSPLKSLPGSQGGGEACPDACQVGGTLQQPGEAADPLSLLAPWCFGPNMSLEKDTGFAEEISPNFCISYTGHL